MPEAAWIYEAKFDARYDVDVEATYTTGITGPLRVDSDAEPFVDAVAVQEGGSYRPVDRHSVKCAPPCRVRYRVRLRQAAEQLQDVDTSILAGGALFAPPSSWLLRPDAPPNGGRFRVHVTPPAGATFATGIRPERGAPPDTYGADVAAIDEASFAGVGPLRVRRIVEPDLEMVLTPGLRFTDDQIGAWVSRHALAVQGYFRRPVADRAVIFVVPGTQEVNRGKTLGDGGPAVFVRLGSQMKKADPGEDWVVAHELVHVSLPDLPRRENWFAEGLATYIEPIARARAGLVSPEKVWGELMEGLPQGLPKPGDHGLVGSEDFGRVYWGGALYFLLADLTIRERTKQARSVDDALRAIAAGGSADTHWTIAKTLDAGDSATGTRVLHELYDRFALQASGEDLDALWAKLGVRKQGTGIRFDDQAPWAALRASITRP